MALIFEFADSEVAPIEGWAPPVAGAGAGLALSLGMAAACLVDACAARSRRTGYARGLRLVLQEAQHVPPSAVWAEAFGRVREGAVVCAGQRLQRLPLDWCSQGPVRLELAFAHGVVLQVDAGRAYLARQAGFAVFESLAC
jgi:hypothetical protein